MRRIGTFVLLALVAVLWFAFVEPGSDSPSSPQSQATATAAPADQSSQTSAEASLPAEAQATIAAIDAGGPFRYDRDGSVFQNREGRLPAHERGYWREYTVDTPGSSDRGARRLVEGSAGEMYYTDDHYGSFRLIRPGEDR